MNPVFMKGIFHNLLRFAAMARHVYVYLELILSLVFVGTSVYSLTSHGDTDTQSLLQWISLCISVLCVLFSCIDTASHSLIEQGEINSFPTTTHLDIVLVWISLIL